MIMWIVACLVLAAFVAWNVVSPLLLEPAGILPDSASAELQRDVKERGLRALKDLDLDFSMGKLTKEDYDLARSSLMNEVAHILKGTKG